MSPKKISLVPFLKVKKQELTEMIVVFQVFWISCLGFLYWLSAYKWAIKTLITEFTTILLNELPVALDSLCSALKNSDDIRLFKILRNKTRLSIVKAYSSQDIISGQTINVLKTEVIEFANDSWSWNRQLMGNVSHEVFSIGFWAIFWLMTRIWWFFLTISLSDHHFRA